MEVNNIPTSEEFFNQYGGYTREEMLIRAIEFAKMHTKTALEVAFDKGIVGIEGAFGVYWNRADLLLDRESIINAYPLNLIK